MIKLVAADMDGTLLNSRQRLSPHLFPIIRTLIKRDVRFAVASGRQYYNLLQQFETLEDHLLFICENGAMVFDGHNPLYACEIQTKDLRAPVELARSLPNVHVILCGTKAAYLEDDDPVFNTNAHLYYASLKRVSDVLAAAQKDAICKIAIFEQGYAEINACPAFRVFAQQFQVVLSGNSWVDLMEPGVNKGSAIRQMQKRFGIAPDQCMAFGDYLNDYEMMRAVKYSYAMANAHPKLRAACRYEAPSNDEDGVSQVLSREFGINID